MEEIVNRIAKSPLVSIDLEEFFPTDACIEIDITQWLHQGLILREKDFREQLNAHDWSQYKEANIALYCSADAILPGWAFLLITAHLQPFAKKIVIGNIYQLYQSLYLEIINEIKLDAYLGKKVMIKGCSKKPVPENAFIYLAQRLLPVVDSLMYGEACSTVPLFKKKK
ncbi:MAG: DUF2480 family protein [Flavobacteriaceae bacterium]|nr:DUF2480 family protein [Flavobacteriaceae bacterium]